MESKRGKKKKIMKRGIQRIRVEETRREKVQERRREKRSINEEERRQ